MTKLQKAQKEVKRLWEAMCREDNVPYDAKFVVFNPKNSYARKYNNAMKRFFLARALAGSKAVRA